MVTHRRFECIKNYILAYITIRYANVPCNYPTQKSNNIYLNDALKNYTQRVKEFLNSERTVTDFKKSTKP